MSGTKPTDMLTARQIREARTLLGLSPSGLAEKARIVTTLTVKRAEADDNRLPIAAAHIRAIRQTLERLGVEFASGTDGSAGVRLREAADDRDARAGER